MKMIGMSKPKLKSHELAESFPGMLYAARPAWRLINLSTLPSTTLADFLAAQDSQISFSVTHGWSAFGGADHGRQDVRLEGGSWTLSQAVFGPVRSQVAARNVSALRVGADRSRRPQEHSADGRAACEW